MAEYRLAKVAKEINRSATAIADFLNSKGFSVDARPTTKITEDMYQACLKEFSADRAAKEEADKLKANQPARPIPTREKVETVETISAPEPIVVSAPESVLVTPIETPTTEAIQAAEVENTPAPVEVSKEEEVEEKPSSRLKVIGKIDLTPKSKKLEEEVKVETPTPVERKEEIPIETPAPVEEKDTTPIPAPTEIKEETPTVEEVKAPAAEVTVSDEPERHETRREVLSGPKVLGKILLPVEKSGNSSLAQEARKDMQEIRKKRKRKEKGVEVKVAVQETVQREHQHNKAHKPVTSPKPEVTTSQVNTNVRSTFNRMGSKKNGRDRKRTDNKEERNRRFEAERRRKDEESKVLKVTEFLTANELATMMSVPVTQVISKCFALGMMVSINQRLDAETIQLVADDFNFEVQFVDAESQVEAVDEEIDNPADLKPRAPIVTVMGHVDHGKTSLLDYIRQENVIAGEAGGITQHIGAYEVTLKDGKKITFLDTPGHEAFTAMRARGAKVTDMAIIVIAADDSVMPQTREAIAHAQAAGVPMIFAFNKIDKDGANADKIREQLASMNILVEDWGGKFQAQEISAKKGLNIDVLLEKVLLEAEMMQLTANPDRRAKGTVIEATQEKGRGIVCTLLIQTGTLRVGDHMVAGAQYAKVRALFNERGQRIEEAPPSTPVKILGFSDAPTSGDIFAIMANEDEAKTLANKRQQLVREQGIRTKRHITLDEIGRRLAIGNFKELKVIVKADVDGSSEALTDALMKLTSDEIAVNVIHSGVGQITESDVLLASASDAIIVGFQVRPSAKARMIAENEQIDIRTYSIIYQAIEEIKSAMEGMLSPEIVEKVIGHVEIREVFKITKVGTIAGSYVTDGKVERGSKIRVIRNGVVKHEGSLASLKRFKDDVKEVTKGYECGLQISNYNDIEEGDYLEVFIEEEVKRKL
ncbi:MAG: translation initiation factor IF-2 [Bacteroidia bacterium]|nr:translation initiation factor IF-2 [Bacteroidia bacterium]